MPLSESQESRNRMFPNLLYKRGASLVQPHVLLDGRPASEATARRERDLQEGIELLTRDVQLNPERWQALWFIGNAHQAVDVSANAYKALKVASALAPGEVDVARELCRECLALGHFEEAVSVADHASSLEPDNGGLRSNLALALLLVDDDDRASVEADEGVQLAPTDAVCRTVQQLVADVRSGQKPRQAFLDQI